MSIQDNIDDLLSRSQTVISDLSSYQETLSNQPEPDTDNISSEVITLSMSAQTSITFSQGGSSITLANGSITLSGNVILEGTDWGDYKIKIDNNETRSTTNDNEIGTLSSLTTSVKTNLVAAINSQQSSLISLSQAASDALNGTANNSSDISTLQSDLSDLEARVTALEGA